MQCTIKKALAKCLVQKLEIGECFSTDTNSNVNMKIVSDSDMVKYVSIGHVKEPSWKRTGEIFEIPGDALVYPLELVTPPVFKTL